MRQIDMHEAQANLSSLVEQAASGEPFVITQSGKPLVTVSAYAPSPDPTLRHGFLKDRVLVPEDFDSMGKKELQDSCDGAE